MSQTLTPIQQTLILPQPESEIQKTVTFLRQRWQTAQTQTAVIAVSGGIDSALALSLLVQALPKEQIFPILLPYAKQNMEDAWAIIDFHHIPRTNCRLVNIQSVVQAVADSLQLGADPLRLGNVMARVRMIMVYDLAKEKNALVLGTENKSEHYLGYFTRFGDEASDVEPIRQFYKTQVRQLAQFLQLPAVFLDKAPSAGLWVGQSDENELGFSYELADQVIYLWLQQEPPAAIVAQLQTWYEPQAIQAVLHQLQVMAYKREVPYTLV